MGLQVGDIVFLDSGSKFNKITQIISSFKFGHVGLVVEGQQIVDIKAGQVMKLIPINELKVKSFVAMRTLYPLTEKQTARIPEYTQRVLATAPKYDYLALVRLAMKYLGFKTSRKSYDIERLYCSEFVDYIYTKIGIDLLSEQSSLIGIDDLYFSQKLKTIAEGSSLEELENIV